ncbi:YmfQ family protein [Chelatococcus reniformis]|uniref:Phage tail protein n=1 Tax=Chelatococcus reniformis TaxID=1494448 RepID=A0A916XFN1_9HYPH|nr:putative phage tail protein [Chelatococcus reniformis]GGC68658.1 phage tail protein [Chelatococcus reniformis]
MPWITASGELYASSVQLTADFVDRDDGTRFARRDGADYAEALANLLPQGVAWSRDPDSVLMQLIAGLAQTWGLVDDRAADLLQVEADPRTTLELLDDWERAYGLPDPCLAEPQGVADRQQALVTHMTFVGRQDRGFFVGLAASLGYAIEIKEYSPFMCGISRVGDTRPTGTDGEQFRWEIGPPEMRFFWTVRVGATRLTWFRVGGGGGHVGIDPHLRIALATDLECMLRRWKPAQTDLVFDYSGLGPPDPMAGTP